MFKQQLKSLCLCLVTLSGITLGFEHGGEKVMVKEDSDAILPCSLRTKENIEFKLFDWRKAAQRDERQKEVFLYDAGVHYNNGRDGQSEEFKGRVSHFPGELKHGNASIIIRNSTLADSGNYTCVFPRLQPERKIFHIELIVGVPAEPHVLMSSQLGLQLQCKVEGAFPKPELQWQDGAGNVLHSEESVVKGSGGHYDVTLKMNATKPGDFRCVAMQEEISHTGHDEIHLPVALAMPSILKPAELGLQLQCDVTGAFPKPKVQWEDGDGHIIQSEEPVVTGSGGRYNITLKMTATEAGYFRCVAWQEEISHKNSTGISLHEELFKEKCKRKIISSFFGGFTVGTVMFALVLFVLVARKCITIHRMKEEDPSQEQKNSEATPMSVY